MIAVSRKGWKVAAFFITTHADDEKARNPLSSEDFKPAAGRRLLYPVPQLEYSQLALMLCGFVTGCSHSARYLRCAPGARLSTVQTVGLAALDCLKQRYPSVPQPFQPLEPRCFK